MAKYSIQDHIGEMKEIAKKEVLVEKMVKQMIMDKANKYDRRVINSTNYLYLLFRLET